MYEILNDIFSKLMNSCNNKELQYINTILNRCIILIKYISTPNKQLLILNDNYKNIYDKTIDKIGMQFSDVNLEIDINIIQQNQILYDNKIIFFVNMQKENDIEQEKSDIYIKNIKAQNTLKQLYYKYILKKNIFFKKKENIYLTILQEVLPINYLHFII